MQGGDVRYVTLTLLLSLITTLAHAKRFRDFVHALELDRKSSDHFIRFQNGRIAFLHSSHFIQISDIAPGTYVEIETDQSNNLVSIASIPFTYRLQQERSASAPAFYSATILPNYTSAEKIFQGMNVNWKLITECTDRAHVWSYEEWKKHNLYSKKVFLFFTNTYIREYRHEWWFHVSPYTLIKEDGRVVEKIMDRIYADSPQSMKDWTDMFVFSYKTCPVSSYAFYRSHKESSEHCYLVKTPMYYRLPYHIRMMEDHARYKSSFNRSEVEYSYRAFND
jgi:hypothetical protein